MKGIYFVALPLSLIFLILIMYTLTDDPNQGIEKIVIYRTFPTTELTLPKRKHTQFINLMYGNMGSFLYKETEENEGKYPIANRISILDKYFD